VIEYFQVLQLNFEFCYVIMWTDKLVPRINSDFSDIMLLLAEEQIFILLKLHIIELY